MTEELTYAEALKKALREEMEKDSDVFIMGEDVGYYGGALNATEGLTEDFGPERVIDTPIAEAAIAGTGIGAAMEGLRPVIEIMYMDFIPIAMEQILNHGAQARFLSGGQLDVPLVVRTQYSIGRAAGPQHCQFYPSSFMSIPGLHTIVPSTPQDMYSLTKSAIESDDPVVSIECGSLYHQLTGEVSEDKDIPIGRTEIKREGEDVTIVAISRLVSEALKAADELEDESISVEVVDPLSLRPLDIDTIVKSVKKTGRLIVTSDEFEHSNSTHIIATEVLEKVDQELEYKPVRITSPDMHTPFAKELENSCMVWKDDLASAVKDIV